MDEFAHGESVGEDTGPGGQPEAHPLERYFAMPAGGWPEPATESASVHREPSDSAGPPAGTSPPPTPPAPPPSPMGAESLAPQQGATADPPPQAATAPPPQSQAATPRGRLRLAVISLALLLVAAGVVGGIVSTSSGPPAPGAGSTPANFVVSSTQTTLNQHTADIDISGTVTAAGQTVPLQGTGTVDFDTNAFDANISELSGPSSFTEHELVVDNQIYIGIFSGGTNVSALTGGPEWINVPLTEQDSSGLGAGNVDPLDQLKLLEQRGATVVPLGTSSVNGVTVSGYAVTFGQAEIQQAEQQEFQALHLTPAQAQQALRAAQVLGPPTLHVYFDGSGLLRQESVSLGGGSSPVSGTVQMTYSNFGTPVTIAPPASNDVVSFTQFEQDAQAYEASQKG